MIKTTLVNSLTKATKLRKVGIIQINFSCTTFSNIEIINRTVKPTFKGLGVVNHGKQDHQTNL